MHLAENHNKFIVRGFLLDCDKIAFGVYKSETDFVR